MSDMNTCTCSAVIVDIHKREDGKIEVYLNQTIFYPQGGGQPWDTGSIEVLSNKRSSTAKNNLNVIEVRYIDGRVMHVIEVPENIQIQQESADTLISIGDTVMCSVDTEKRVLHSRLHSAGHLIDMALKEIGLSWKPTKGYHFPNGPYVEYEIDILPTDLEVIKEQLEKVCADIIRQNIQTSVTFDTNDGSSMAGPGGKPLRTVWYGDFGIQCGGTHVSQLSDIGVCYIRKIKKEGNGVRVGYQVE